MRSLLLLPLIFTAGWQSLAAESLSQVQIDQALIAAANHQSGQSLEPFRQLEILVRQGVADPAQLPRIEKMMVKLLEPTAAFEARCFAAKQLGIIESPSSLPALARLLGPEKTTGIACLALTTYPRGKADERLRASLPLATGLARIQIINTIGNRRDPASVPLLSSLVSDPQPAAAEASLLALGKIGNRAAWKTIAAARRRTSSPWSPTLIAATLLCADHLAAAGERTTAISAYEPLLAASEPPYARRSALEALIRLDKDHGEKRIQGIIRGSDSQLKSVAIAAVRDLPSKNASELFGTELSHLGPDEQIWMINSLGARGDAAALTAIARALGSTNSAVRLTSISALGLVGNAAAVPGLAQAAARCDDVDEGRAIESALVALKGGAATDGSILSELAKSPPRARAWLISAIAKRQGAYANGLLFKACDDPDPAVAKAAFRSLGRTASPTQISALLDKLDRAMDPGVRSEAENAATQALAGLEDPARRSASVIAALQRASNLAGRISLLGLLPVCGDAEALKALEKAAVDSNAELRDAALRALTEWPTLDAWVPLLEQYRHPANLPLRGLALRGLVRLVGDENPHADSHQTERYVQLLSNANSDADLKLILGALGGANYPDALQLAMPLLSNAAVRAEAELAVRRIAETVKAKYPQAASEALQKLGSKP